MSSLAHCVLDSSFGANRRRAETPPASFSRRRSPIHSARGPSGPTIPQLQPETLQAGGDSGRRDHSAQRQGPRSPAGWPFPPLPGATQTRRPRGSDAEPRLRGHFRPPEPPPQDQEGGGAGLQGPSGVIDQSERWGRFPRLWPLDRPKCRSFFIIWARAGADGHPWMAGLLTWFRPCCLVALRLAAPAVPPIQWNLCQLGNPCKRFPMAMTDRGVCGRPWLAMNYQPFEQACPGVGPASIYPKRLRKCVERLTEAAAGPQPFRVVIQPNAKCP